MYNNPSSSPVALRCQEQRGTMTLQKALATLERESAACPLTPISKTVEAGQLLRNQIGTYWRVNSIHPPTGFCWIGQCDWKGNPLGPYGGIYASSLISPYWFLVQRPISRPSFLKRVLTVLSNRFSVR